VLEVRSGEGLVFLDPQTDEYSCCYEAERLIGAYSDLVAPVRATGLDLTHPVAESGWVDAQQSDLPRLNIGHVIRFLHALALARFRFQGRSVAKLAAIAQTLGARKPSAEFTRQQLANLFRYLLALTPFRPKCLLGSFALLHFLDRYGHAADWVFGVQLFPFRAHCWIAADGALLNELKHSIEDFQVIWVVAPARV